MANITLCKGTEAALPTTTGTATSFSGAGLVRLYNSNGSNAYLVSVVETQSGSAVGTFTLPAGAIEYLQKKHGHHVFAANAAVLGAKVGFTN